MTENPIPIEPKDALVSNEDIHVRKVTGTNGKEITLIAPLTPKGLEIVRKMDEAGEIDTAVGFADRRNEAKRK